MRGDLELTDADGTVRRLRPVFYRAVAQGSDGPEYIIDWAPVSEELSGDPEEEWRRAWAAELSRPRPASAPGCDLRLTVPDVLCGIALLVCGLALPIAVVYGLWRAL